MKDDQELAGHSHRSELPDGRGWKLTFSDLDKLRPQLAGWPLDPMAPDYLAQVSQLTATTPELPTAPFLYVTDAGIALLNEAGIHWVRDSLLKPGGPKLEHAIIAGKACTVRRMPADKPTSGRRLQAAPDYLQQFGLTRQIVAQLDKVADHFRTFKLEPALIEYAAGHTVLVTEYRQGEALDELRAKARSATKDIDMPLAEQTRRWWQHWFDQFDAELDHLKEMFFLLGYEKGEPFTLADFGLQHFSYNGFDTATGRPRLSLMDQISDSRSAKNSVMDNSDTARTSRYHEISGRYIDDPLVIRLRG